MGAGAQACGSGGSSAGALAHAGLQGVELPVKAELQEGAGHFCPPAEAEDAAEKLRPVLNQPLVGAVGLDTDPSSGYFRRPRVRPGASRKRRRTEDTHGSC